MDKNVLISTEYFNLKAFHLSEYDLACSINLLFADKCNQDIKRHKISSLYNKNARHRDKRLRK